MRATGSSGNPPAVRPRDSGAGIARREPAVARTARSYQALARVTVAS